MDRSMNTAPLTVTQPVHLELIDSSGAATPIEAELRYDPAFLEYVSTATARRAAFGERAPDPPRPPVRSAH